MELNIFPKNIISGSFLRFQVFYIFIPFIISGFIFSGTTGKISGTVIDTETKEKLAGVNIIIEGTTIGTATDVNGQYVILQLPPGIYNVISNYIGYATVITKNVQVSTDLTTKLDCEN